MRARRCAGCDHSEDIEVGARFVVVASCMPLSGVYCRGRLAKRDAALGQSVEAIQ
jgi:hypothetical protein